jgi:hypothetical protein
MGALRQTDPASASSARGNAEVDVLRVGFILDGRGHPTVLRRALYGEPSVEDSYKDGREGGMGITYHRAREACHKSWHPLCGKGGALQGRLLHDGTGVRITEHNNTYPQADSDKDYRGDEWVGTPLQWLVPIPRLILPPCDPHYAWALPKQPPLPVDDEDEDDGVGGDGDDSSKGGKTGEATAGFCQLHSTSSRADVQHYQATQMDAEARAAARLNGVADAKQLQKMFHDDAVDDAWQQDNGTNATDTSEASASDTPRTADDVAWAHQLKAMACGSPHSADPLLETNPTINSGASTSRDGSTTGSVTVVDWRLYSKESEHFTDWAVNQGVPLLLKDTAFVQWVAERTSNSGSRASADEKGKDLNNWSWAALESRLADFPMLEAKRSGSLQHKPRGATPTTGSSTEHANTTTTGSVDASVSFFDPDVRRAPMSWSGLVSAGVGMNMPDHRNDNDDDENGSSNINESGGASGLPYEIYNTTGRDLLPKILLHESVPASLS